MIFVKNERIQNQSTLRDLFKLKQTNRPEMTNCIGLHPGTNEVRGT